MKITRLSKYFYLRFIRLKGEPRALAMGTAIGVFVGITPTIPFHTLIILGISMSTRTSAIAGIIASWVVCNPLTYVPIYYFSMVIGNIVTPYELSWQRIKYLLNSLTSHQGFLYSLREISGLGFETIIVMLVGGAVLAIPFTVTSYYFSLYFFNQLRKKKAKATSM